MSTRSRSTTAVAVLAIGLAFLVTAPIAWAKKPEKPEKPDQGGNTPPLVTLAILSGGTVTPEGRLHAIYVTSDGNDLYADERADGDVGVESFLFPSGNFGLHLEGSNRRVNLQFGTGADWETCPKFSVLPWEDSTLAVEVEEFANVRIDLVENDCEDPGLLCIPPGDTLDSGLYLKWRDPMDSNTQFLLQTGAVSITRHPENPENPELPPAWTISTQPHPSYVCVTSRNIKGKPTSTTYGLFEMALDLVVFCEKSDCS